MSDRGNPFIGFIVVISLLCIAILTSIGAVCLGTRSDRIAVREEMKATLENRNETINRLELKLEFLERHCRWLIFLKQALPSDIAVELDALAEQLKQRKEKAARMKYEYPESPAG